jgi:hypothetical protein
LEARRRVGRQDSATAWSYGVPGPVDTVADSPDVMLGTKVDS